MTQIPYQTFNPGIPSMNSHTLSTGVGFMCSAGGKFLGLVSCGQPEGVKWMPKGLGLDFAFQAWLYENRTIQGNQNPTVNGTYHTRLYLGSIGLRAIF